MFAPRALQLSVVIDDVKVFPLRADNTYLLRDVDMIIRGLSNAGI